MRIAIDAMGGDKAPDAIISGAIESLALLSQGDEVILVGPKDIIEPKLPPKLNYPASLTIVHAPDVIGMDDPPIESLRKQPRSSISILAILG